MQRGFSVPSVLCVLNDKCGIIPMLASAACGAAAGGSSPRQDPSPLDPLPLNPLRQAPCANRPPPDPPLPRTPLRRTAQNFALFFPSPAPIFALFFSLWGSSRVFLSLSGGRLVSFFLSGGFLLSFFLSLEAFSWNFGGVFEGRNPQMCSFGSRAVV